MFFLNINRYAPKPSFYVASKVWAGRAKAVEMINIDRFGQKLLILKKSNRIGPNRSVETWLRLAPKGRKWSDVHHDCFAPKTVVVSEIDSLGPKPSICLTATITVADLALCLICPHLSARPVDTHDHA